MMVTAVCGYHHRKRNRSMKKVLFISTGGTIASAEGEHGLSPSFDVEQLLKYVPEVKDVCNITGKQIMNIDSTNMNPDLMVEIGKTIYENYDDFDSFVVTHGTDTMAYSSAALTYMLQNIKKPVVITGSQIAIGALYTDAKKNISDAIIFSLEHMAGVYIAFDGKIINGTRAMKVRTKSMNAFESINFPYIAQLKLGRVIYNKDLKNYNPIDASKPFQFRPEFCPEVYMMKVYPGMDPSIFDFVKDHYKGVIIESFGIGGIPNDKFNLVDKIHELVEAKKAVVITTQCLEEGIELDIYEVGVALAQNNIICAGDMTTEAILAKLRWALGNFTSLDDVKCFMETPVNEDITM